MHRFIIHTFIANVLLVPMGCAVAPDRAANPSSQGSDAAPQAMTVDAVAGMPVVDLQGHPMIDTDRLTALRQAARSIISAGPSWAMPAGSSLVMFQYRGSDDVNIQLVGEDQASENGTRLGSEYSSAWRGRHGGWSALAVRKPAFQVELFCQAWGSREIRHVLPQVTGTIIDAGDITPEAAPTFTREFAFINEDGERVPVPEGLWLRLNGDNPHHAGRIVGDTLYFDNLSAAQYLLEGILTGARSQPKLSEFVNVRRQGTTWITLKASTIWMDAHDAMQRGKAEKLPVLLYFSANWSGDCRHLEEEVYSDPLFAGWCKDRVVPCQLDRSNVVADYENLRRDMAVTSYPTVVIWDAVNNTTLGRIGYQAGGAAAWMQAVDRILAASQGK